MTEENIAKTLKCPFADKSVKNCDECPFAQQGECDVLRELERFHSMVRHLESRITYLEIGLIPMTE
ncbi:MAG: hypothetical protein WC477_06795 [Patescibacteria group bacterium]